MRDQYIFVCNNSSPYFVYLSYTEDDIPCGDCTREDRSTSLLLMFTIKSCLFCKYLLSHISCKHKEALFIGMKLLYLIEHGSLLHNHTVSVLTSHKIPYQQVVHNRYFYIGHLVPLEHVGTTYQASDWQLQSTSTQISTN